VPFWEDILLGFDGPVIRDGFIKVPEAPGLWVDLNEDVTREYALKVELIFG
jgi:L-alanine-DL-glutamate epimerase-like enolase superfamily enzyme